MRLRLVVVAILCMFFVAVLSMVAIGLPTRFYLSLFWPGFRQAS